MQRGTRGAPRVTGVVGLILGLSSISSCAAADDVFRGAARLSDDADSLRSSRWVPPDLPPAQVPPSSEEIGGEAARLASPARGVPEEEHKDLVRVSCEAADYVEGMSGTEQDLAEYLGTRLPNGYSYRLQAEQLARNLIDAGSSGEQAVILGRAAVCQWASS